MSRIQQLLKTALLATGCAALASLTFLILKTYQFERTLATSADAALVKSKQTLTEANRFLLESELTMKNLRQASGEWQRASKDQTAAITSAMTNVSADLVKIGALVDHTDATLNSQIGPQTMAVLRAFGGTVESLDADARALKPVLDNAAIATADVDKIADIAAAQLPETLDNVRMTTRNVADITADVQQYIHRMTRPPKAVWGILKAIGVDIAKIALVFVR